MIQIRKKPSFHEAFLNHIVSRKIHGTVICGAENLRAIPMYNR